MAEYRTITPEEVPSLKGDIESTVELVTDYGRERADWERVVDKLEEYWGADLGSSWDDPTIKAILKVGRKIYRELREAND